MKKIVFLITVLVQMSVLADGGVGTLERTSQGVVLLENLPNEESPPSWRVQMSVGSKDLNDLKSSNRNYKFNYPKAISAYIVDFGVSKPIAESWFINFNVGYSSVELPVAENSNIGKLRLHLIPINLGLSYVFVNSFLIKPILKLGLSYNIINQTGDSDGSEFFKNTSMGFYEVGLIYLFDRSKKFLSGTYRRMEVIDDSSIEFSSDSLLFSYNIII